MRLALLALLAACHSASPPTWPAHDDDAHITLIRVRVATDGMGFGSMDEVPPPFASDATTVAGELYACPQRVEGAVRRWAKKHQLVASRSDVHSQEVIFELVTKEGRFDMTYRRTHFTALYPRAWPVPANENKEVLVQTELVYTTTPANAHDKLLKDVIATYEIEPFMHDLSAAMSCDAAGNPPKLVRPD